MTSAVTLSGTITGPDGVTYSGLPSFCSVTVLATPSSDSTINMTLWMPTDTWNGRFEATGNGGYAGSIAIDGPAMVYAIQNGWAVEANDMGTAPSNIVDGDPLIGHPEKWTDWGYRATAVTTTLSKQLIHKFYGRPQRYSYFNGCSTGGEQALMLAQKYPDYFDGILGGDPGNDRTHLHAALVWIFAKAHATPTSLITPDQASTISNSVVAACAAQSGGLATDTFLTDPRKCTWQPSQLQCTSTGQTECLNPNQVQTANAVYAGPTDPVTGAQIFPGSVKGSENASLWGWYYTMNGVAPSPGEPSFNSLFKWVFGPEWVYTDFDFHNSMAETNQVLAGILNYNNPDLSKFRAHGGKLIIYHGFADPLVSPGTSLDYYTNVVTAVGNGSYSNAALSETQKFYRLFMVPGMNHCVLGNGPNQFGNQFQVVSPGTAPLTLQGPPINSPQYHALLALAQWVEKGIAPKEIIATKYVDDTAQLGIQMQRPLCPYPQLPHYRGNGNPNSASSFVCSVE